MRLGISLDMVNPAVNGGGRGAIRTSYASSINLINSAFDGGARGRLDRWAHFLPRACTEIQFSWNPWWMDPGSTGGLSDPGNAIVFQSLYAEVNGVGVVLTIGGTATPSIASGSNDNRSQVLTPAMFGISGGAFPAGTTFYVKTDILMPANGNTPKSIRNLSAFTDQFTASYDPTATTPTGMTTPGQVSWSGSNPGFKAFGWAPFCIGKLASTGKVFVATGDSLTGNDTDTSIVQDGQGWFQRACSAYSYPCGNLAVAGSQAVAGQSDPRLAYWYGFATEGIVFYGTNDFDAAVGNVSLATGQARVSAIVTKMRAAGVGRVGVHELLPKTTSSNSFVDEAGQTIVTNWQAGGTATQFNASIPASVGADYKLTSASVRGTDPNKWKVTGAANAYVTDGIHYSTLGATSLASENAPQMGPGEAPSYDTDAVTLFNAMTTQPNGVRKGLISKTITDLKTAALWTKIDVLWMFAAHSSQASLLDWKSAGTYTTAPSGGPGFTPDRGWQGNGSTQYLTSNWTPSTNGVGYTLNSGHVMVWNRTERAGADAAMTGATNGPNTSQAIIYPRFVDDNCYARVNDVAGGVPTTGSSGMIVASRLSSTSRTTYRNGVSLGALTVSSVAVPTFPIAVLAYNSNGGAGVTSDQCAATSYGAGLTSGDVAAYDPIIRNYMTAVGA